MTTPKLPDNAAALLRQIADDPDLMQAVHLAVEDHLIELRDSGMMIGGAMGLPANGFAVRNKDGSPSEIIRLGTRPGIQYALRALADHLDKESTP
jgi:hypothetical protein